MTDWVKIRAEYVSTNIGYRPLAKKYGISFSTLEKKARKENWQEQRIKQRDTIETKVLQKTAETVAYETVDYVGQLGRISTSIADALEQTIAKDIANGKMTIYKLKPAAETLRMLKDMQKEDKAGSDSDLLKKARELLGGVPDALDQ